MLKELKRLQQLKTYTTHCYNIGENVAKLSNCWEYAEGVNNGLSGGVDVLGNGTAKLPYKYTADFIKVLESEKNNLITYCEYLIKWKKIIAKLVKERQKEIGKKIINSSFNIKNKRIYINYYFENAKYGENIYFEIFNNKIVNNFVEIK